MPAHTLRPLPIAGASGSRLALSWKRFRRALLRRVVGRGVDVFSVRLATGRELRLHDVAGWTVACASGAVWITQEADARDIFLKGGEGFALDRAGLTLVCACRDALVIIRAPTGRRAARLNWSRSPC